ncbi:hypothetical protein ACLOJK_011335 [Asimina triloba]
MAKEPETISDGKLMRAWSRSQRSKGKTIALVPTMGYLHRGHLSLIREAQKRAEVTVVSVYVNPGQFSPSEDLATYPSDFQGDLRKLREAGVDAVFHPQNLYDYGIDGESGGGGGCSFGRNGENPSGSFGKSDSDGGKGRKVVSCLEEKGGGGGLEHETWVRVERLEKGLCGNSRPVFFRGVATVVAKLFNIVEPDVAIFGKKDYQQWRLIRRMVRDLDFDIDVIGSEIVRDSDGLAMSSRNVHLSPEERDKALSINKSLSNAKSAAQNGQTSGRELRNLAIKAIVEAGGKIDYAETDCHRDPKQAAEWPGMAEIEIVDQESLEEVEEIRSPVVFCIAAWFGKSFSKTAKHDEEHTLTAANRIQMAMQMFGC